MWAKVLWEGSTQGYEYLNLMQISLKSVDLQPNKDFILLLTR